MNAIKGNLLIIDDEKDIGTSISSLMKNDADKIFLASNALDALKILEENEVHCIVSDIKMPQMDGVTFIKKVRAKNMKFPFIFITGFGTTVLVVEAFKYGAIDFVYKPLLENIDAIIRKGLRMGVATGQGVPVTEDDLNDTK